MSDKYSGAWLDAIMDDVYDERYEGAGNRKCEPCRRREPMMIGENVARGRRAAFANNGACKACNGGCYGEGDYDGDEAEVFAVNNYDIIPKPDLHCHRKKLRPNNYLIRILLNLDFGPGGIVPTMYLCENIYHRYCAQSKEYGELIKRIDKVLYKYAVEDLRLVRCLGGSRELCMSRFNKEYCYPESQPVVCEDVRILQRNIDNATATLLHQIEMLISRVRALLSHEDCCITAFLRRLLHDLMKIDEALHDFRSHFCVKCDGLQCVL